MKSILKFPLTLALLCPLRIAAAAGPDHSAWDLLLKRYVNVESAVDYRRIKKSGTTELDAYLEQLARPWSAGVGEPGRKAALINAYNALMVRWIVTHYPVQSVHETYDPFYASRHTVDGGNISLDDLEKRLRDMGDPRIHAALLCAARSCPPLRPEAYDGGKLDEQLDDNTRKWLSNKRLNEFFSGRRVALVSSIFKWYSSDFGGARGITGFLARFAPAQDAGFLDEPGVKLEYREYDWSLNDAGRVCTQYSRVDLYLDVLTNYPMVKLAAVGAICISALLAFWIVRRAGESTSTPIREMNVVKCFRCQT